MTEIERYILEEHKECDTIKRLDTNKFEITKGRDKYLLYTDPQGNSGRKYSKSSIGLLSELRKGKKYSIEELLNGDKS